MNSIAVVVLDTLRADTFSTHFDFVSGMTFENAFSTSHWTMPAHASLWTGQYGSEVGVQGSATRLPAKAESLPQRLAESGYTTRLWTANMNLVTWEGWTDGFEEVIAPGQLPGGTADSVDWQSVWNRHDGTASMALDSLLCLLRNDHPMVSLTNAYRLWTRPAHDGGASAVRERIATTDFGDAEFLFLNLMETHNPYRSPEDSDGSVDVNIGHAFADAVEAPDRIRAGYRAAAKYASSQYEAIYERLLAEFDFVVTLSDHGELLGEHGMWNHGYGIYPELAHVPLVVSGRGVPEKTVTEAVSLLDVHATVATMAGIDVDTRGVDLMKTTPATDRLVEYRGFLDWHRELLARHGVSMDVYDAYDPPLDGVVTPDGRYRYQTHDGGFEGDAVSPDRMESLVADLDRQPLDERSASVTESVQRRLRDLGYA